MKNNYTKLKKFNGNTLNVFLNISYYNTVSKLYRGLSDIDKITIKFHLDILIDNKLIVSNKNGREIIYSYTLKGLECQKLLNDFNNYLNKISD